MHPDPTEARPQPLSAREAGLPLDTTPYEGIPEHLEPPLRQWARSFLTAGLERRVALTLGVALPDTTRVPRTIDAPRDLVDQPGINLLDVVDVALQLDQGLAEEVGLARADAAQNIYTTGCRDRIRAAARLMELLDDANSAYRVGAALTPIRLVRRVDPTLQAAADQTATAADPTTADLLRQAWVSVYGRQPDPHAAYSHAVRAVERAIAPIVSPDNPQPTLGTALRTLESNASSFELVLVDDIDEGGIEPLHAILKRLWQGQRSRHGGGPHSRDQTPAEAEAAVVLAVTCVHWLSTGVLRLRGGRP